MLVIEQLEQAIFLLINLIARAQTHISKQATLHVKHLIATGEDEEGRSQCRGSSAFLPFSRLQVEEVAVDQGAFYLVSICRLPSIHGLFMNVI